MKPFKIKLTDVNLVVKFKALGNPYVFVITNQYFLFNEIKMDKDHLGLFFEVFGYSIPYDLDNVEFGMHCHSALTEILRNGHVKDFVDAFEVIITLETAEERDEFRFRVNLEKLKEHILNPSDN